VIYPRIYHCRYHVLSLVVVIKQEKSERPTKCPTEQPFPNQRSVSATAETPKIQARQLDCGQSSKLRSLCLATPAHPGINIYINPDRIPPMATMAIHRHGGQTYHQTSFSRPATNYIDAAIPTTRSDAAGEFGATGPSDADIDRAVQALLRDADLNSITKREIRRKLEEHFGMDLSSRKGTINAAIDHGLLSHA
jgi:hypothetical protein